MNKKIMKKWVKLLRSGEFKQGRTNLDKNGKYCCLGVLCNLALTEGAVEYEKNKYTRRAQYGEHKESAFLPPEVIEWAGMRFGNIVGSLESKKLALSQLNDRGVTFKEIADIIEENYKEL